LQEERNVGAVQQGEAVTVADFGRGGGAGGAGDGWVHGAGKAGRAGTGGIGGWGRVGGWGSRGRVGGRGGRGGALLASTVEQAPLPPATAAAAWVTPRDINRLEYFASATDICRAYTSLAALARRPGLAPIGQVLSLNDDSLALDPAQWQTTWFKGGSEPGVLTMAYLATTRTGHSYVVTVLAEDPAQPIDETLGLPIMLSAIKGAFALAARG
jgi:hypothetical protein